MPFYQTFLTLLTLLFTISALSHPGGTKRSGPLKGCHHDRKIGNFHCHNGNSWPSEKEALQSFSVASSPQKQDKYVRKDWSYPSNENGNCRNTRAEILISRSKKPVTFTSNKKCVVKTGEWEDFYYPETITEAAKIQIDHLVPLKNAHLSGGSKWTPEQKKKFANDHENLVVTSIKTNQQKGALDINAWLPINHSYACRYMTKWISVKKKYGLNISDNESNAVINKKCPKS